MNEYIKKEIAIDLIDEIFDSTDPTGLEQMGVLKCRKAIREVQPAADVAEVVRCKDCKFSQFIPHNGKYSCCKFMIPRLEQDFCSSGERKEGLKNG